MDDAQLSKCILMEQQQLCDDNEKDQLSDFDSQDSNREDCEANDYPEEQSLDDD